MNALLATYGNMFGAMLPLLKIVGIMLVAMFFVMTLNYQKEALKSMIAKAQGKKKLGVVYKDNKINTKWANFKADFEIYPTADKEKFYALSNKGRYYDQFNEPITFFNQDTTEEIRFVPRKKMIWVDKETGEPLLDAKGKFVNSVNLVQFVSMKYKQVADEKFENAEKFVRQGLVDDACGIDVRLPNLIGEEQNGIDGALTADIINRHMEIEMLNFLKKHWGTIVIVGMIILLCTIGSIVFSVQANNKIDAASKVINYIAANINQTSRVVIA